MNALDAKVRSMPREPGCYLWKDNQGVILYVGKAQDLRARTSSYLTGAHDARIQRMVMAARDIDFVATRTVAEALVLEQTLIKRHRPTYNVMMIDDKSYPYIAVTREKWPRVVYTRDVEHDGAYFGPFPDATSAKRVARMLNKGFRLRQCRSLPTRECLYYHIGQCTAPCIQAVTHQEYAGQAEAAHRFLRGEGQSMSRQVRQSMKDAARAQRYEDAASLRDLATSIESVLQRQDAGAASGDDADAIGVAQGKTRTCAVVLVVRNGSVVGKEHYFLSSPSDATQAEIVTAFLDQYYTRIPHVPPRVLSPIPVDDVEALEALWTERAGRRVRLSVPQRGEKRRWLDLAAKNAQLLLEQERLVRNRQGPGGLEALAKTLALPEPPGRIECFDVSHHKGEHTVASMVVLIDGKPNKTEYRRFKIQTTQGGDDPGAIREAVSRRYRRVLAEQGADALADLIVIDGGQPQLAAARAALLELGLPDQPVVGLAKRLEEIHVPQRLHTIRLPRSSPALHVLQRIRDEAHRFAVAYQDRLKRRALTRSQLDDVKGIGPKRKRALLRAFGSLEAVRAADVEALCTVPGMTRTAAVAVVEGLKQAP